MTEVSLSERATRARERLLALASGGARTFAPSAYSFAEALVARGERLGGTAGARLVDRAVARAEELSCELEEAKARARAALAAAGGALGESGVKGVEAGETGPALRAARRLRVVGTSSIAGRERWVSRLTAEARARGVVVGNGLLSSPEAIASALYASSRAELSAALVAIHAEADVPLDAGPYNALAIAARAIAELSTLAPAYLTAMVAYLDELSPLLGLPPAASAPRERPPARAAKFRRNRGGRK